ncbi:MAG TPA: PPC domain-containing DNA-binding protein [Candidatus Paceibacterota bacterium]
MEVVNRSENFYTLSFQPGEDLISGLTEFARENKISAGHITGLGACGKLHLAYYDLDKKEYIQKVFEERLEILSLVGNISLDPEGKESIHLHGVFGKSDFSTLGGHVMELIISGVGEIHIQILLGAFRRSHDPETGLNFL